MAMKVTEPGVYDMPAEDYHGDPCPEWSLSSSSARLLASSPPAVFKHQRENPPERRRVFDIGNAGHLLVLEPHLFDAKVEVIVGKTAKGEERDDYRTDDAVAKRDAAYAAGKIPLLRPEVVMVKRMREALWRHAIAAEAFRGGAAERTYIWRDAVTGRWCRARPDYTPPSSRYLIDYKTAASADPEDFAKAMLNFGYHQQAAWLMDGHEAVTGERPERFAFVVQEKEPPYLVSVCWVDAEAIEFGRELNRYALGVFNWCMRTGEWPGYVERVSAPVRAFTVHLPPFAIRQHLERSQQGAFLGPDDGA